MKKLVLLTLFIAVSTAVWAQKNTMSKASDSDPAAKATLDKVRKKYESYQSLEAAFSLAIEIPEQEKEVQKGTIARQGEKYRLQLASQEIICDGKALWLILHNNKEVQINDMPEEEEENTFLSPQSLFTFYESGQFVYAVVNEIVENGKLVQQIEFKPLSKDSEYSKIRMSVDKKTSEITRIIAFGKDNSRYSFTLDKLTPNKAFAAAYFTFDKAKFPGYHVEDLRF